MTSVADLLFALSLAGPSGASTAPGVPQPVNQETIIVTGERVPRSQLETPSSVAVISANTIEAQASDRIEQVLTLVPNVQLGSGEEGPAIRGQDSTGLLRNLFAFLGGARPRVTLSVDGRAVSYYEYVFGAAAMWDVERVEVFRSPQTTTQGRNSIAGGIFVSSQDPTYSWEARARGIVGEIGTRQVSAVLSGPILDDQLAVRVVGDLRLGRMSSDLADGISGADIDRDDYGQLRVKLLAEPQALPGMRIETAYVHTESQAPQFEGVRAPFRARRVPGPDQTNGIWRTNVDLLTTAIDYQIGPALKSTTTLSYGDVSAQRFGLPGLGRTQVDAKDVSGESIVSWRPADAVKLLAGAHILTTRQRQFIDITGIGIGAGTFRDRQDSVGLFSEGAWQPTPRLAITTGLRYQRDRQDRRGQIGPAATGVSLDYEETFDAWLPKVSVAFDLTDAVTAGLLVQRAYNPGGTSISLLRRVEDRFEPETLWNYEAFLRGSFDGGRGTIAANLFYNDIKQAQRSQTVEVRLPNGASIFPSEFANAPAAESYGAEFELGWRANRRLSVRGGLGLLETTIKRTLLARDPSLRKEFQRAPKLSAAAEIDWRPIDALRLSAQLRHHNGYYSDDANTPSRRIAPTTVVDARTAYTTGPITLFGYARNLFDEFYLTYLFTPTFGTAGDPREVGIGLEAKF